MARPSICWGDKAQAAWDKPGGPCRNPAACSDNLGHRVSTRGGGERRTSMEQATCPVENSSIRASAGAEAGMSPCM